MSVKPDFAYLQKQQSGGALLMFVGVIIAGVGVALSFVVGILLYDQYQAASTGSLSVGTHQFLYEGLWFVFFLSLAVLGISLLFSGFNRRRHNVVPGPTLYLMGASLLAIALMMIMYGQTLHAVVAAVVGVILMVVEWYYDAV